jgi:uncharacterized protein YndB with AHSA1/START domain
MAATSAAATDNELVITRVFDAPCGVVFEAWTDPKHLVNWWGPFGFTTTVKEIDVRPGGVWRLVMHGPDGRDYHNRIIFLEIIRPSLLVFKHEPEPGAEPSTHETTVRFEPEGPRTRLTMRMRFDSAAERERIVKTYKADTGAEQTLQRLADHLSTNVKKTVTVTRVFNAPRELVWKVWTNPKHVANWWGPHRFTNPVCEWDPQVNGKIYIEMQGPDGSTHPMNGTFVEAVPPERISFIASVPGPDGNVKFQVQNTATFVERPDGKTLLTVEAKVISTTDEGLVNLAGMEMGWTESLERVETEVKTLWK